MNKYKVKVNHVFYEIIEVEAENEEQAKEAAIEEMKKPDHKVTPFYQQMFDKENWQVITEEQYKKLEEDFNKRMEELQKQQDPDTFYGLNKEE